MTELEKNITEKLNKIFKEEFGEDFELNYNITDEKITFFVSINEGIYRKNLKHYRWRIRRFKHC